MRVFVCIFALLNNILMPYDRTIDKSWNFNNADTKEYTHCYHTYPAMMIPQVARRLLSEYKPPKCELLFDPYMGSGTSLVEASIASINSVGTDLNPLARLMAQTKTTKYDISQIKRELAEMEPRMYFYDPMKVEDRNFDRISNHVFWYSEDVLLKLSYLHQLINEYSSNKEFFYVALAEVVREASFTRNGEFKRFRMKEDKIKDFHPDVFGLFEEKVLRNINGLQDFEATVGDVVSKTYGFDSSLNIPQSAIEPESVDMVVTSPPYGDSRTTVAYGQFSRWANEWFGFENAKDLDRRLMGGKTCKEKLFTANSIDDELAAIGEQDIKRYFEVVSFLNDYWLSIRNVAKTIRNDGIVCYVVGNRNVKGIQIPLDYFTAESFEQCGFHHIKTIVRDIPSKRMPSKTSPTNIAGNKVSTMSNEYIVILRKTA